MNSLWNLRRSFALILILCLSLNRSIAFASNQPFLEKFCRPILIWLDQKRAIDAVQIETGATKTEIQDLITHYIDKGLANDLAVQKAGQVAFQDPNRVSLKVGNLEVVHYGQNWFYRTSDGNGLIKNLTLDQKVGIPTHNAASVLDVFDKMIIYFSLNRVVAENGMPYFINADVNGQKLTNEALPTPSYPLGFHSTGDAILRLLGETLTEIPLKGFTIYSSRRR